MAGNDSNTKLLLHMDGSGSSFTDSAAGATAHTVTAVSTATQSASGHTGFGNAVFLNGTSDGVVVDSNADYAFGSGDWALDFWVWNDAILTQQNLMQRLGAVIAANDGWRLSTNSNGTIFLQTPDGAATLQTRLQGGTAWEGQWVWVVLARSGTTVRLWTEGVYRTQWVGTIAIETGPLRLGHNAAANFFLDGRLDEVRISTGTDRGWNANANITVPTEPYNGGAPTTGRLLTGLMESTLIVGAKGQR